MLLIVLLKILVNIRGDNSVASGGEFEFEELNVIHDGNTVDSCQNMVI